MKHLSPTFKWLYIFFISLGIGLLFFFNKISIHQYTNQFHSPSLDTIFIWITKLAEPLFISICVLFLLFFKSIRLGLFMLISTALSGTITQLLKHFIFSSWDRPYMVFKKLEIPLRTIGTIDIHNHFSFPSGHTTAAFALFTSIHLVYKNSLSGTTTCLIAILCGYSRIYLSQHFLQDVIAGSVIGTITAIVIYHYFVAEKPLHKFDKGILELYKSR